MRVMVMLKSDAQSEAGVPPDQKMLTDMTQFMEDLMKAGVLRGGEGLHASAHGARVRIEKGKTRIIDGPFAEAKELVAGYFLLETKDLQAAIDWMQKIPGEPPSGEGEIELRPLFETEDFPVDAAEKPGGWRDKENEARTTLKDPGPSKGLRYISLLKGNQHTERGDVKPSPEVLQQMGDLAQEMQAKGVLISGDGLRPSRDGAKIVLKGGRRRVIEGPFTETKELIGGFMMYRATNKAEAVEWARRWLQIHVDGTGVESGEIEVRRVHETDEIPTEGDWREREKQLREQLEA